MNADAECYTAAGCFVTSEVQWEGLFFNCVCVCVCVCVCPSSLAAGSHRCKSCETWASRMRIYCYERYRPPTETSSPPWSSSSLGEPACEDPGGPVDVSVSV